MDDQRASDTFGELALADTTLSDLLRNIIVALSDTTCEEFREEIQRVRRGGPMTTNQAAVALESINSDRLPKGFEFPKGFNDWIRRVRQAADQRNAKFHAEALDRCINCGHASNFKHKGEHVDRSPEAIRQLTDEFDRLTQEGLALADDIAHNFNKAEEAAARDKAAKTGKPQGPPQVVIGQTSHKCGECSETGRPTKTVRVGTALVVHPPGTSVEDM